MILCLDSTVVSFNKYQRMGTWPISHKVDNYNSCSNPRLRRGLYRTKSLNARKSLHSERRGVSQLSADRPVAQAAMSRYGNKERGYVKYHVIKYPKSNEYPEASVHSFIFDWVFFDWVFLALGIF